MENVCPYTLTDDEPVLTFSANMRKEHELVNVLLYVWKNGSLKGGRFKMATINYKWDHKIKECVISLKYNEIGFFIQLWTDVKMHDFDYNIEPELHHESIDKIGNIPFIMCNGRPIFLKTFAPQMGRNGDERMCHGIPEDLILRALMIVSTKINLSGSSPSNTNPVQSGEISIGTFSNLANDDNITSTNVSLESMFGKTINQGIGSIDAGSDRTGAPKGISTYMGVRLSDIDAQTSVTPGYILNDKLRKIGNGFPGGDIREKLSHYSVIFIVSYPEDI